jgi:signal transduction histidine kinase
MWWDWALVGALISWAVLETALRPDLPARLLAGAIAVALTPTLLWRRTRPLLMVAIAFGTCAVASLMIGGDLKPSVLAYLLLLPYALFRWGSGREMVLGSAILLAKLGSSYALGYLSLGNTLAGLAVLGTFVALGTALRYRARARQRELDQVALLERERLARDLHDTVAHHVSAMAIRAQAGLATSAVDPRTATDALRVIEAEASKALSEMRTMVRALRGSEPAEYAPTPRLADLAQLTNHGHPPVTVEIAGDVDDVPPAVSAALYRLAQESVTNARRHARHPTRVQVCVEADDTSVRLQVSDDGDPVAAPPASRGYGLMGMRERVSLLGGTFEAGPGPDRGWMTTAVLPRDGSPA